MDQVARTPGVGETQLFGSPYAMQIWLNPDKLTSFRLTPADAAAAIREQNTQLSAGQLGGMPAVPGTAFNATITAQSRLTTAEEFRDILLRVNPDGSQVRLGDVARVELGPEERRAYLRSNGVPNVGLGIVRTSTANALDVARAARAEAELVQKTLPEGTDIFVSFDSTVFIRPRSSACTGRWPRRWRWCSW